ncbi:MAG TPA: hypothetical protein VE620_05615 [Myxococcales bacterium]|jgi:hypothetical protein|nr:hypothetical protein [Myxococcales bacterium]
MTVVEPQSWIARTRQRSKAIVTLAIACFAPAAAVLAFAFGEIAVAVALLAIAFASFVAFATLIRCPRCRKPISWMVLTTRPSGRWLTDLFALEECPICDDRGRS